MTDSLPLLWRGQWWPGYRASPDGTILGKRAGAALRPCKNGDGRHHVSLCRGGKQTTAKIHQIIAATFIGPRPDGCEVAHWDGNPSNNAVRNLRYATKAENEADKVLHGTAPRGEQSGRAKLTAAMVREIRARRAAGEKQQALADEFGVSSQQISKIATGKNWRTSHD